MTMTEQPPVLLALGAHPDDVEFGCGGVLLAERARGTRIHLAVCSRGEAGTNGDPETRTRETAAAAAMLDAELTFLEMGGDAHLAETVACRFLIADLIRQVRPRWILAPTTDRNQHPDHAVVGRLARDAARCARYGNVAELKARAPHAITHLLHYAVTSDPSVDPGMPLVYDISAWGDAWRKLMECHASQMRTRQYLDLQWARARAIGIEAGVELAHRLWNPDRFHIGSLAALPAAVRHF